MKLIIVVLILSGLGLGYGLYMLISESLYEYKGNSEALTITQIEALENVDKNPSLILNYGNVEYEFSDRHPEFHGLEGVYQSSINTARIIVTTTLPLAVFLGIFIGWKTGL